MESLSFEALEIIHETFLNIRQSILMLQEWNEGLESTDEWTTSSSGMQKLAANSMLIEAIGEAVKKIEKRVGREFLNQRPEIPWQDVISMRNHIAHGYFELDDAYVFSVIKKRPCSIIRSGRISYLCNGSNVARRASRRA